MTHEKVLILDYGSKFSQIIARKIRDLKVYSEIKSYKTDTKEILAENYKGIIITGPSKLIKETNFKLDPAIIDIGIPILSISSGAIILNNTINGKNEEAEEYTNIEEKIIINELPDQKSTLFRHCKEEFKAFVDYYDTISSIPQDYKIIASSKNNNIMAFENSIKKIYALMFHIEVNNCINGENIFKNFVMNICKCTGDYTISSFIEEKIEEIKETVGDKKVLCALSGGVDSSVCAALINKAIGKNLTCIFVDTGLMRKNEAKEVYEAFKDSDMNLIQIDAENRFLTKLKGVTDPEQKRKIIGEEFIRVFEEEAKKIGQVDFLAQGTIYPDIIESGLDGAKLVKSHHNVGGLPEHIDFKELIEPLKYLFKDEVRAVGASLDLPKALVVRQPFPGPGLGIRVIGELTKDRLDVLREADAIFREEIATNGLSEKISQYFVILTDLKSVGVYKDSRTYDYIAVLRAIKTTDFMTADYVKLPYEVLDIVTTRICNEVDGISRLVYDITNKPPATIEWE